jgi:hypothetical protein
MIALPLIVAATLLLDPPPETKPPVVFPHPLITEVLYAVPNGNEGDANKDGTRQVAGDEFVELVNPHSKPIQLLGYSLTDRNPAKKGQLKFTFPAFELPPGGVVVVFNGCECTWGSVGPVGDERAAPGGKNDSFHGAYVFSAKVASTKTSFANSGDFVCLRDPSQQAVQVVKWGTYKEETPACPLVETAPLTNKGSVQRESVQGAFAIHATSAADPKVAFSPGKFELPERAR